MSTAHVIALMFRSLPWNISCCSNLNFIDVYANKLFDMPSHFETNTGQITRNNDIQIMSLWGCVLIATYNSLDMGLSSNIFSHILWAALDIKKCCDNNPSCFFGTSFLIFPSTLVCFLFNIYWIILPLTSPLICPP